MIITKVRELHGIKTDIDIVAAHYYKHSLYVIKSREDVRVFLKSDFTAYEVLKDDIVNSQIVGLIPWLESEVNTANLIVINDIEVIRPRWFHSLPAIKLSKPEGF